MNNLNNIVLNGSNLSEVKLSKREYAIMQCSWENENMGNLNEEDGIECELCKNKGIIYFVDENDCVVAKNCECTNQRKTIQRLKNCGITKNMLERYTFKNFVVENEWQKNIKEYVLEYCKTLINDNVWMMISGISGCGKTHLCTAVFQRLIKSNRRGEYLLWNEEVPKILALEKSSYEDNQIKYESRIKFLQEVDVLYIDDFLKLTQNKWNDDSISLAYKIINSRYNNNKITIISSEYSINHIKNKDTAIAGRIIEKSCNGKFILDCGNEEYKNWRIKQ